VTVREVRVDEALWDAAGELRRLEWRTLIVDLLDGEPLVSPGGARMVLAIRGRALELAFHGADERRVTCEDRALFDVLDEYLAVIKRMTADDLQPSQLEALDMAKRVVHDRGACALAALAPDLGPHESLRRLFSLVVAVWVDTTALPAAHRHAR